MKTLKNKILAVVMVATLGVGVTFAVPAEGTKKLPAKSAYETDKARINKRASGVVNYEAKVQNLEAQLKADKKAGNDVALVADRQNLRKAKADLAREKAYLRADEKALKQNHCVAIKAHKKELKEDRAELRKTKRQLRKDIRQENETAILTGSARLVKKTKEVRNDEVALENQREGMKTDLAWADEATDRKPVRVEQNNLDHQQADMAYEGARWLIKLDYD